MSTNYLSTEHVVIIGAGQAAIQTADSLRAEGFDGRISIFGDEAALPYQRPQLSKDLLKQDDDAVLPLRPENFFASHNIELHRGRRIVSVDSEALTVTADNGEQISYTQLVFATGSRARQLKVPGGGHPQVRQVRTVEQALQLRTDIQAGTNVVIVGGGFIGLEIAAHASTTGANVTLLPGKRSLMSRSVSPAMSAWFEDFHRNLGTDIRCGETAVAFTEDPAGNLIVESTTGASYEADIVVVGIGSEPNVELARDAGLKTGNGIEVNAYLQASQHHMWALGDCASFPLGDGDEHVRLESIQNATDQGKLLARNLMAEMHGHPLEHYEEVPWFWSYQANARLQIAGRREDTADTAITLGDPESGKFSILLFNRDGHLRTVESLNSPAVHMAARKVLNCPFPLTIEEAQVLDFCLKAASKKLTQLIPAA